jgi:hypothetical protein
VELSFDNISVSSHHLAIIGYGANFLKDLMIPGLQRVRKSAKPYSGTSESHNHTYYGKDLQLGPSQSISLKTEKRGIRFVFKQRAYTVCAEFGP